MKYPNPLPEDKPLQLPFPKGKFAVLVVLFMIWMHVREKSPDETYRPVMYSSKKYYQPEVEAQQAFDRLNHWRRQAGLPPLEYSPKLAMSAANHARYISENREKDGHQETRTDHPFFTGGEAKDRVLRAGWLSDDVGETGIVADPPMPGKAAVDDLMTALYHRITMLDPHFDTAGAGWARHGGRFAMFINHGNSVLQQYCQDLPKKKRNVYHMDYTWIEIGCNGPQRIAVDDDDLYRVLQSKISHVAFPTGNDIDPAYFGNEIPNPVPDLEITGNPVSISFYGSPSFGRNLVQMRSFQLFAPEGEVRDVRILTAKNDPNQQLNGDTFALFPIKPLRWSTEYRVEFRYIQHGQQKKLMWQFRTRSK